MKDILAAILAAIFSLSALPALACGFTPAEQATFDARMAVCEAAKQRGEVVECKTNSGRAACSKPYMEHIPLLNQFKQQSPDA